MAGQRPADRTPFTDTTVVDTDVHLSIPFDDLAAYLDEPYRSMTKNPTYTAVHRTGWDRYMGGKIESQKAEVRNADALDHQICDVFGIDYPLINTFAVLNSVPEDDRAVAMMRAYNEYLLDNYLDEYDHFRGLASVAVQKPDKAAEELDRIANEDQIVGVYILNSGAQPPLGHERYDVLYEAAADNDLDIAYHGSAGAPFAKDFPIQDNQFNRFLANHIVAHPWAHMLTLTSLLVNGTPEKFPELNFTFLEAGYTWVPYMMFRFNKEYAMRRNEAPLLEKTPEEYVRDQFYFGSQPVGEPNDPRDLDQIIDVIGPDRLTLSTDFPHWDFDHPDALKRHVDRFDEADRERILSGSAIEAFGLDL
ncbi:MAG: amidohydrolase family protein [Halobacteriales archaeon]